MRRSRGWSDLLTPDTFALEVKTYEKRFQGDAGRRLLIDTLNDQKIVSGNNALAEEIADAGELIDVQVGTSIIEQDRDDNDVYLILVGVFMILVNGKKVATRVPNDHVGEMAAIQQTQRRSATVVAAQDSVVLKLTEPQIAGLGQKYPEIYRWFAKDLARRLMQRNLMIASVREKAHVFVISSVEAFVVARAVQTCFEYDPFTVTVWTDGVFRASHYPIESLERHSTNQILLSRSHNPMTLCILMGWPSPRRATT